MFTDCVCVYVCVYAQVSSVHAQFYGHVRLQRRSVFQGEAQAGVEVPSPPLSAGGTGEEEHLPSSRGQQAVCVCVCVCVYVSLCLCG